MKFLTRFFEILPATLAFFTLALPFLFLESHPRAVLIFTMLYIFLWFLRAIEFGFFLASSYFQYRKALKKDWRAIAQKTKGAEEVLHLILLPTYKEEIEVLRSSLGSIAESDFEMKKVFVGLATEERDAERGRENAAILEKEFGKLFGRFFWIEHPKDLPGEIAGKGANISFAGERISEILRQENFPIDQILVTTLDADNRIHEKLLTALSVEFARAKNPHQKSFQPIPLFLNNLWDVPIVNRMIALSSGFWHLIEAGRPDRLRNFSSHSQPLSALVAMDFWDKTTIVEDGRQFFRSFLHFRGKYEVIPVFLPIFQDAVLGKDYFRSLIGQFHQLRRWAWGASDVAYFSMGILRDWKNLPLGKSFLNLFRLIEGHYMWATTAVFLFLAPWSARLLNPDFLETPLGIRFAVFLGTIFQVALFGILISIALTFLMVPPPPPKSMGRIGLLFQRFFPLFSFLPKSIGRIGLLFQWILLPITTIVFGSFPALWAQTQLAFGKKMKFNVTEKVRKLAPSEKI